MQLSIHSLHNILFAFSFLTDDMLSLKQQKLSMRLNVSGKMEIMSLISLPTPQE